MVYVISQDGIPLMPTKRYGKVRRLLKQKLARVIRRKPFTIQLQYATTTYTQPVSLGIDSGYTYIGFSAVTDKKELISGELKLLSGISERLKERLMYRRMRRARLRYRKPRFDNRAKPAGWLAPSIQHKLDSHIKLIQKAKSILPITNINIEVANFDIQKIKNPDISGTDYQNGDQKGFYNLREYILYRDNYTCQLCGRSDLPLEVHHIGYWKHDRTDRPSNLVTLCTHCHTPNNHLQSGKLYQWQPNLKSFRDATFMSTVRWKLVNKLRELYSDMTVNATYGYITKSKRIDMNLPKSHYNDAFCIAGGTSNHTRVEPVYFAQSRRNNRSLEKFYDAKYTDARTGKPAKGQELFNGRRTRNKNLSSDNLHKYRGTKLSKGRRQIRRQHYFYQPNDLVKLNGKVLTVSGVQNKGQYIKLAELPKPIRTDLIKPYMYRRGIYACG